MLVLPFDEEEINANRVVVGKDLVNWKVEFTVDNRYFHQLVCHLGSCTMR